MSKETITAALTRLDSDLVLLDETVADAAALFAAGELDQADLDGAVVQRDALRSRRQAMHEALVAMAAKDSQQCAAEIEAERLGAVKRVRQGSAELEEVAGRIEAAVDDLVAFCLDYTKITRRLTADAFAAGYQDRNRTHLTDMRPVSGLLADKLTRSGIAGGFDYITVAGCQHFPADTKLVDVIKKRSATLIARAEGAGHD